MYDELIGRLQGRDVVAVGSSTGALIALGLRSPQVKARLLIEPFLRVDDLWPLIDFARGGIARNPEAAQFWGPTFGIGAETVSDHDYAGLLDSARGPILSIVGDAPLGERREIPAWPSLADERTREALRNRGRLIETAGGHGVLDDKANWGLFTQLLRQAVSAVEA
jgi:hypothetical protein